jgi:uncharacterized protein YxeA
MDKNKYIKLIALMIIVIVVLIIDIAFTILHEVNYNKRVDTGNERWIQIENRIKDTEEKVQAIENELQ